MTYLLCASSQFSKAEGKRTWRHISSFSVSDHHISTCSVKPHLALRPRRVSPTNTLPQPSVSHTLGYNAEDHAFLPHHKLPCEVNTSLTPVCVEIRTLQDVIFKDFKHGFTRFTHQLSENSTRRFRVWVSKSTLLSRAWFNLCTVTKISLLFTHSD